MAALHHISNELAAAPPASAAWYPLEQGRSWELPSPPAGVEGFRFL